ncbi:histidine kinase, partial [filamentous cyanobacterium CCP5]
MEASVPGTKEAQFPLNLLLFIDKRPSSAEQVRAIRRYLKTLEEHFEFNLE